VGKTSGINTGVIRRVSAVLGLEREQCTSEDQECQENKKTKKKKGVEVRRKKREL